MSRPGLDPDPDPATREWDGEPQAVSPADLNDSVRGPTLTLEAFPPLPRRGLVRQGTKPADAPPDAASFREPADAVRRARLQAATGFFIITLGSLLAWRAATGGGPVLWFQTAVVAVLAATYALLAGKRPISVRRLRAFEFSVFALTAAYLGLRQYQGVIAWIEAVHGAVSVGPSSVAAVVSAVKTTLIGTMLMVFAYCMLMPNRWRTAGLAVLAMIAVPVTIEFTLFLRHTQTYTRLRNASAAERVAEDVGLMLIAAGLSVYGTHVINSLRTEAFAARQLNQYWLVRRLGKGGMGEVYLAEHRLLKRPCAVKIIGAGHSTDPIELARFEREVRATARLSHPNTVEVFDYGRTEGGTFFYVMEYLPGLSLDELVKRYGPMPPGRVIYLLRQVCGALAEAHRAGLVHRDVKPGNVFASYRGGECDVAKLLDFGLVKGPPLGRKAEAVDVRRAGMVRGTPLYMSPEQIFGDSSLDARCDLYALGAVAYLMLTGRPPFLRETRTEVMSAHAYEPVVPPGRLRAEVPADLDRVVVRCLEKDPADRFADAEALGRALAACGCAHDWDAGQADRWWHANEPESLELPEDATG